MRRINVQLSPPLEKPGTSRCLAAMPLQRPAQQVRSFARSLPLVHHSYCASKFCLAFQKLVISNTA